MADISQDRITVHIETGPGVYVLATLTINNHTMPEVEPTLVQLRPVVRAMKDLLAALVPAGPAPVARRVRQPPPVEETV